MTNRITNKDLEVQVQVLNRLFGYPNEPYSLDKKTNKHTPNPNVFHLSYAYGGVALHQMSSKVGSTGVSSIFNTGHIPKRELHIRITSYIAGVKANTFRTTLTV